MSAVTIVESKTNRINHAHMGKASRKKQTILSEDAEQAINLTAEIITTPGIVKTFPTHLVADKSHEQKQFMSVISNAAAAIGDDNMRAEMAQANRNLHILKKELV